ncbi:lipocalin-like domain-containing protein [Thalassotalea atypica]|uniref:lipocalin-like domain-containing protein n=1 Tax=Thalassotalea atypica TaxID=2054316 RepID=UPI002573BF69|nr:lipocalin-like domain-containing protein [Thalassotalea atypica]
MSRVVIVFLVLIGASLWYLSFSTTDQPLKDSPLKNLSDTHGDFKQPSPNHVIRFPAAHAPQKDYRQEWWYLTANLTTESGKSFASQWTLFRRAVQDKHWYFAHAALADNHQHMSSYRNGREDFGNVIISSSPFLTRIDDWQWSSSKELLPATLTYGSAGQIESLDPQVNEWKVALELSDAQPFYLQGQKGFSRKHQTLDTASHYYSQPFIKVTGNVYWQGKWQKVTGDAWFDREWGSQMLADDQQGWDWFSLRLDKHNALMVYRIRSTDKDYVYASIMTRSGEIKTLAPDEISVQANKGLFDKNGTYPQSFSLKIPQSNIDLQVDVVNDKQIMRFGIEYFEGKVTFSGSHQGQGFLEMTGYK